MNTKYNDANTGNISVDNEVIKNIALKAATEVEGIHGIRRGRLGELWGSIAKKNAPLGVRLDFANDSELSITLKLTVEYGRNIPDAVGAAQERVKKAVEHMTGLTVIDVAVKITGMQARKDIQAKENQE